MLLTVDVGNSRVKGAVFDNDNLIEDYVFLKTDLKITVKNILNKFQKVSNLIIASVGNLEKDDLKWLERIIKIHVISNEDAFPFKNLYLTPNTLGIDRLVLTSGAVLQYPNKNRLIIDAGTCVTYDFVDAADQYFGGAISPGLSLRYGSLHNFTAKLPLLSLKNPEYFIGTSTETSMHSGVVNGIIHELNGFISQYEKKYPALTIILTGGDADFLAEKLKKTIFVSSNFLLRSMNQIFYYKNQK